MRVYIGADHRGFKLKEELKIWFMESGIAFTDVGADSYDSQDDYPVYAEKVAHSVSSDFGIGKTDARGILICGSGVGVDIVANKFRHIRSGLAVNVSQIKKARMDDDINILAIPADYVNEEKTKEMVKVFLEIAFSKEDKRIRRLNEIEKIEDAK